MEGGGGRVLQAPSRARFSLRTPVMSRGRNCQRKCRFGPSSLSPERGGAAVLAGTLQATGVPLSWRRGRARRWGPLASLGPWTGRSRTSCRGAPRLLSVVYAKQLPTCDSRRLRNLFSCRQSFGERPCKHVIPCVGGSTFSINSQERETSPKGKHIRAFGGGCRSVPAGCDEVARMCVSPPWRLLGRARWDKHREFRF